MSGSVDRSAEARYEEWRKRIPKEDPIYPELLSIEGNRNAIEERFGRDISFGTAGLRGICEAGTNRMNRYTVGRATAGIADYLAEAGADPARGVVIAYDCRYHSREFSELAAEIFTARGIRVMLFHEMRATPELSFLIRRLGAAAGVNMTASHNPKEYNGYKVYWEDGAQISGSVSDGIASCIAVRPLPEMPERLPLSEAEQRGLLVWLGEKEDGAFLDYVLSMQMREDSELDLGVPIVYTPLNGAGRIPVETAAARRGFSSFFVVPEQADPDPEFTTVGYPNPEDPAAFAFAEKLGRETGAEVLIATDPDSDRMAVEIRDETAAPGDGAGTKGGYRFLNGNQTGALIISYMAESLSARGALPEKAALIKSIVTDDFGRTIADSYGIRTFEALTGFKNICGRIPELAAVGYSYFFGYEESIGCAPGEAVRDKDGVTAAMLVAELAAAAKKRGESVRDVLDSLYRRYGCFADHPVSMVLEGEAGQARIDRIMEAFRESAPDSFCGSRVTEVTDFRNGHADIPPSNVLKFCLETGDWFCVRPSGTEPKLKFYTYTVRQDRRAAREAADALAAEVTGFADRVPPQ